MLRRRTAVALRPPRPEDYDDLYQVLSNRDGELYERFQGQTPSPEDFVHAVWIGVLVQLVAEVRGRAVGILSAHAAQLLDGVLQVGSAYFPGVSPEVKATALAAFLDRVFETWPLRKVYLEVPEHRRHAFLGLPLVGAIARQEGCLRSHEFFRGGYESRYIYAIYKTDWEHRTADPSFGRNPTADETDAVTDGVSAATGGSSYSANRVGSPGLLHADVPPLVGRRVFLRPVADVDHGFLLALSTDEAIGFRWRFRGETPSPEQFYNALWRNVLAQFVICRLGDGAPIGHVVLNRVSLRDRTGYVSCVTVPELVGRGHGFEASGLFYNYVFKQFGLRKIYGDTPTFNVPQFSTGLEHLLHEEARLVEHQLFNGDRWDYLILATYRAEWEAAIGRDRHLIRLLSGERVPRRPFG